jgi:hypothetical protein
MVDSCRNGLSQYRNRSISITRRPKHLRTGELHGAIPHSLHAHCRSRKFEAAAKVYLCRHSYLLAHALMEPVCHGPTTW